MSMLHQKRIVLISVLFIGLALATGLILFALSKNIDLFYTPTQVAHQESPRQQSFRVGGMVVKNSVKRNNDLRVQFTVTDFEHNVDIHYQGILPDLFREGQGVVAQGKLDANGVFQATQILAKHDENYMPPEVAPMLKSRMS